MSKLVKNKDGSIHFGHEDNSPEKIKVNSEKEVNDRVKAIKEKKTSFKDLTPLEKDTMLEHLLKMHNII